MTRLVTVRTCQAAACTVRMQARLIAARKHASLQLQLATRSQQQQLMGFLSTGGVAHAVAPVTVARRKSSEAWQMLWEGMGTSVRATGYWLADLENARGDVRTPAFF